MDVAFGGGWAALLRGRARRPARRPVRALEMERGCWTPQVCGVSPLCPRDVTGSYFQ
ncbi:MAG: hypothetical protein R8F89_16370 [Roseobacter sp.]|nr:hypothetical protein [Roseobacter sp.]